MSALVDEFPQVKVGDMVLFTDRVVDPDFGYEVARKGDIGHVVSKSAYSAPTLQCERTGLAGDAIPRLQFEILCEAGFATTPETTPKKPRREFVRRGAV